MADFTLTFGIKDENVKQTIKKVKGEMNAVQREFGKVAMESDEIAKNMGMTAKDAREFQMEMRRAARAAGDYNTQVSITLNKNAQLRKLKAGRNKKGQFYWQEMIPGKGSRLSSNMEDYRAALEQNRRAKWSTNIKRGTQVLGKKEADEAGSKVSDFMRQAATRASGAIGFTLIDIGTKIQNAFSDKTLRGQISGATSNLAGVIGSIFGGTVSAVARDLGKAAGTIAELFINVLTYKIRVLGRMLGGAIKALGYTIASGLLAAVVGGATGGIGALPILFMGAIFAVTAGMQMLMEFITETLTQIGDIFSKSVSAILSIVTAGVRVVFSVVSNIAKGITQVVKSLFKGILEFSKMSLDKLMNYLAKFTESSIQQFVTMEKSATKAAKEIADIYGTRLQPVLKMVGRVAVDTGSSFEDAFSSAFDVVSSGYRNVSEGQKILSAASKVAIKDMSSMATATNALITVWENYRGAVKDVNEVASILNATTTVGRTDLEELGPAFKLITSSGKRFNVELKDLMGTWMTLTKFFGRGSASTSARYFSRMLEAIYMPSSKGAAQLRELGIDAQKLMEIGKGGGANFGKAWVEMLQQLSKIPVNKIRDLFPTIQARRFSVMLTPEGINKFKDVRKDMDSVMGAQGKQEKMGRRTTERVFGVMSNVLKSIQMRFGEIIVKTFKFLTFSGAMEKQWKRLGNIMFSNKMASRVEAIGTAMNSILLPVAKLIYRVFKSIVDVFEKFAKGELFDEATLTRVADNVAYIVETISAFFDKLNGAFSVGDLFEGLLTGGLEAADKLSSFFANIVSDPKKMFGDIAAWATAASERGLAFVTALGNALVNNAAIKVSEFGQWLANAVFSGFGNMAVPDSVRNLFSSIADTAEIAFLRLFADVLIPGIMKFREATNPFVKEFKSTLSLFVEILAVALTLSFGIAKNISLIYDIFSIMNSPIDAMLTSLQQLIGFIAKLGKLNPVVRASMLMSGMSPEMLETMSKGLTPVVGVTKAMGVAMWKKHEKQVLPESMYAGLEGVRALLNKPAGNGIDDPLKQMQTWLRGRINQKEENLRKTAGQAEVNAWWDKQVITEMSQPVVDAIEKLRADLMNAMSASYTSPLSQAILNTIGGMGSAAKQKGSQFRSELSRTADIYAGSSEGLAESVASQKDFAALMDAALNWVVNGQGGIKNQVENNLRNAGSNSEKMAVKAQAEAIMMAIKALDPSAFRRSKGMTAEELGAALVQAIKAIMESNAPGYNPGSAGSSYSGSTKNAYDEMIIN